MTPFIFIIMILATWRITHLIVEDAIPIVAKPREWIINRKPDGNLAYLLGCTYCTSVWVAAAVVGSVDGWLEYSVPLPIAVAAALSIATAFGETVIDWFDRFGMEDG